MAGYGLIRKIRDIEERCDILGFMLCHSKYGINREFGDVVAVKPKDQDSLPIYARDAELFVGSIDDLEQWLKGIQWAREYDRMLGISDDKKRTKKEDHYRHERMLTSLKKDHTNDTAAK